MKHILFIIFVLAGWCLTGQNLVVNGSFENTSNCPIDDTTFNETVSPWRFLIGEGDFYHPCGFPGSDSATNNSLPFDGQGFVGIDVYGETNPSSGIFRRQYLHGELSQTLDSGKFYRVSFYVRPLNNDFTGQSLGVNSIGLAFSDTLIEDTNTISNLLAFNPAVVETDVINEENYWTSICGVYKAKGGESFLTLGNFSSDLETSTVPLENSINPLFGYLLVDFVEVVENDLPELPADTIICEEDRIDLVINEPGFNVNWSDGSTGNRLVVTQPGIYSARIGNGFCSYTDSITIEGVYCEDCELYIPKAFSPNDDGINEEFEIYPVCAEEGELLEYSIRIFDRWGRKVFESNSPEVSWNGKNVDDHQGVYTYTIRYRFSHKRESKTRIRRGYVTLVQ